MLLGTGNKTIALVFAIFNLLIFIIPYLFIVNGKEEDKPPSPPISEDERKKYYWTEIFTGTIAVLLFAVFITSIFSPIPVDGSSISTLTITVGMTNAVTSSWTNIPIQTNTPTKTFISTQAPSAIPITQTASLVVAVGEITKDGVWFRTGPGVFYEALDTLFKGTRVTVHEKSVDSLWLVVSLLDGRKGWVYYDNVQTGPPFDVFPIATAPPTQTPRPTALPPDEGGPPLCHDEVIYKIMMRSYGSTSGDPNYDSRADLDDDGDVDLFDYNILLTNWSCP